MAAATANFAPLEEKMRKEGCNDAIISAFRANFEQLVSGAATCIPEASIQPATKVDFYSALPDVANPSSDASLLTSTVVLKLNGGLGTSMGLERAKSLLTVKGKSTFLDIICNQVHHMRKKYNAPIKFMLMNSFSTSDDTLSLLSANFPDIAGEEGMELMQNKVPKIEQSTFLPASYESDSELEWCPPGHGDLYAALLGSGRLDSLLKDGYKYMFVSNSDNLGATLDLKLLRFFAESGKPFLMEVAERTEADKKGGHLAEWKESGKLLLRESAQCAKEDEKSFQDISRHRFFNTNNLWVNLPALKAAIDKNGGFIPLPMIKNSKTVDPRNSKSTPVFQLETAMGAAIEAFDGAGAVCVPRSRFAPVKTCNDLVVLRSDAYTLQEDGAVEAAVSPLPLVDLDPSLHKLVDAVDELFPHAPSLKDCHRLTVRGPISFPSPSLVFKGTVSITNPTSEKKPVEGSVFDNAQITL